MIITKHHCWTEVQYKNNRSAAAADISTVQRPLGEQGEEDGENFMEKIFLQQMENAPALNHSWLLGIAVRSEKTIIIFPSTAGRMFCNAGEKPSTATWRRGVSLHTRSARRIARFYRERLHLADRSWLLSSSDEWRGEEVMFWKSWRGARLSLLGRETRTSIRTIRVNSVL